MASWRLTVRDGSRVTRSRYASLDEALDALRQRIADVKPHAEREEVKFFARRIEPADQVAARAEIAGPQRLVPTVQGGLDLRGDGSAEAYSGGWRRRLIELRDGEDAIGGLERALRAAAAQRTSVAP